VVKGCVGAEGAVLAGVAPGGEPKYLSPSVQFAGMAPGVNRSTCPHRFSLGRDQVAV